MNTLIRPHLFCFAQIHFLICFCWKSILGFVVNSIFCFCQNIDTMPVPNSIKSHWKNQSHWSPAAFTPLFASPTQTIIFIILPVTLVQEKQAHTCIFSSPSFIQKGSILYSLCTLFLPTGHYWPGNQYNQNIDCRPPLSYGCKVLQCVGDYSPCSLCLAPIFCSSK